jgi:hypothetical protein
MFQLRTLAAALLLATASSCAPSADANKDGIVDGVRSPDSVTAIAPSSPTGTVSGQIVDTLMRPLANADVQLVLGEPKATDAVSYKTTTDANGKFGFLAVPAGSGAVVIASKPLYGTVRVNASVPAAAGQFPLNNGNASVGTLVLTELNGSVKFTAMTTSGRFAKGVKAILEVTPAGFQTFGPAYGTALGVVSAQAQANENGVLEFTQIPTPEELARVGGTYAITVAMHDEDGDGRADFLGLARTLSGQVLYTAPPPLLVLEDARSSAPLEIQYSNLGALTTPALPFRSSVKPVESLYVVFNQQVVQASITVKVVAEDCGTNVPVTKSLPVGNVLVIVASSPWEVGKEYNLQVRATSLESGLEVSKQAWFFGSNPSGPLSLSTSGRFQVKKATGNTNINAFQTGDSLFVIFDQALKNSGDPMNPARLFINTDLNNNSRTGGPNDPGELGSPFADGWAIIPDEPIADPVNGTFACAASGYTTRYRVSPAAVTTIPTNGIASGIQIRAAFPRDNNSVSGYETIWGLPVSGEVVGSLTVAP